MDIVRVSAVIPAAGVGRRFAAGGKKQFYAVEGKPVLYYTLAALKNAYHFNEYVIGASREDWSLIREVAGLAGIDNVITVNGGPQRADTVMNALAAAKGDYVLIHDAVRPFITQEIVQNTIDKAVRDGGAVCGLFARDTVKVVRDGRVIETLDRGSIFLAHTPQVFDTKLLMKAFADYPFENGHPTDEASVFEKAGHKVSICLSSQDNIKMTESNDIDTVKALVLKHFY